MNRSSILQVWGSPDKRISSTPSFGRICVWSLVDVVSLYFSITYNMWFCTHTHNHNKIFVKYFTLFTDLLNNMYHTLCYSRILYLSTHHSHCRFGKLSSHSVASIHSKYEWFYLNCNMSELSECICAYTPQNHCSHISYYPPSCICTLYSNNTRIQYCRIELNYC